MTFRVLDLRRNFRALRCVGWRAGPASTRGLVGAQYLGGDGASGRPV
jgi:hypothetical protein